MSFKSAADVRARAFASAAVAATVAVTLVAFAGGGCDGSSSGGAKGLDPGKIAKAGADAGAEAGNTTAFNFPSPQTELAQASVSVQGGSAPSPGGQGQPGGTVHFVATNGIAFDPALAVPAAPAAPAAPADATAATSSTLAANLTAPGSIVVAGDVSTGGGDAVRQITAGGDIFVEGTLRSADLGAGRQGLTLNAPAGTVYVTGAIDTSGALGGQAGGPLTIVAAGVVVAGKLVSAGGDGASAGAAGAVSITASQAIYLTGLNASGGGAHSPVAALGGSGGNVTLHAGTDVVLSGTALFRGGYGESLIAAAATGGGAGTLAIDGGGTVTLAGIVDGRGGIAVAQATAGAVVGGAAGAIKIGETTPPSAVAIVVPLLATGGDGAAVGGAGGTAHLEPHGGDLRLAGLLDASGGSSAAAPGIGGNIFGNPGPAFNVAGTESMDVAGAVIANGGSISAGGSGNGATGGVITLEVLSSDGNTTVEPTGQVQTDGGASGGAGVAGGGGIMYLFSNDGNASLHGALLARGGDAPDPGGTGGGGGFIYVFTDNNHGGTHGGALIIETDGYLDSSGGSGTIGGSARNNGRAGSVANWPVSQTNEYDVEQTAALINSDGKHGPATGYIDNRGIIVARGGKSNGSGGDIQFHGKRQDGNETPLSGNVDMAGDGTGMSGDYAGE